MIEAKPLSGDSAAPKTSRASTSSSEAEAYISIMKSGAIAPHSEQFAKILKFIKSYRKSCTKSKKKKRVYKKLVEAALQVISQESRLPIKGRLSPAYTGQSHLLAGLIKIKNKKWFVKIVSPTAVGEYVAARAFIDGELPREGENYTFSAPHSLIVRDQYIIYTSLALPIAGPLRQNLSVEPNDVLTIVRGLAELNVSMGVFDYENCPSLLLRNPIALEELKIERIGNVFSHLNREAVERLHWRFLEIQQSWPKAQERSAKSVWGLAHGDLASNNGTLIGDKLIYLDIGQMCFAPLGSDLYWLLYKNNARRENQEVIIAEYSREIRRRGIEIDESEVFNNAFTRYVQKWIFPSKRGTASSVKHIMATQSLALDMLR